MYAITFCFQLWLYSMISSIIPNIMHYSSEESNTHTRMLHLSELFFQVYLQLCRSGNFVQEVKLHAEVVSTQCQNI